MSFQQKKPVKTESLGDQPQHVLCTLMQDACRQFRCPPQKTSGLGPGGQLSGRSRCASPAGQMSAYFLLLKANARPTRSAKRGPRPQALPSNRIRIEIHPSPLSLTPT